MRFSNIHCNYCVRCRCFVYYLYRCNYNNNNQTKMVDVKECLKRLIWLASLIYGKCTVVVIVAMHIRIALPRKPTELRKTNLQTKLIFNIYVLSFCWSVIRLMHGRPHRLAHVSVVLLSLSTYGAKTWNATAFCTEIPIEHNLRIELLILLFCGLVCSIFIWDAPVAKTTNAAISTWSKVQNQT